MPLAILEPPPLMLHLPAHRLVLVEPASHRQVPAQLLLAGAAAHRAMPMLFATSFTTEAIATAPTFNAARLARATLGSLHHLTAPTGLSPDKGPLFRGPIAFALFTHAIASPFAVRPSRLFLARLALANLSPTALAASLAVTSFATDTLATLAITAAACAIRAALLAPTFTLSRAVRGPFITAGLSQRQRARADHDEQSQYLRRSTHGVIS